VIDDGAGFDPLAVRGKDTLGLVSMRERARLVQGQLDVTSRLGDGTRVEVRVPVREV
jgi:signal transduction histidine kinase